MKIKNRVGDNMKIACDEAGFTGPDLLSRNQRYFSFASVNISDEEAEEIIAEARKKFPVQMPELKGSKLIRSATGGRLVDFVVKSVEGRFCVNAHDKLLALCGWLFEYVYEPILQYDPDIFYQKNLHRFVAMFTYLWMDSNGPNAREIIEQFQAYMRTKDIAEAPALFDSVSQSRTIEGGGHPFDLVRRFANGYKLLIEADNRSLEVELPDRGTWVLDLSAACIWSHLNYWGQRNAPLEIICDGSKPLQAIISNFTGDEKDPAIRRMRRLGNDAPMGWTLKQPIEFGDSKTHASIQIADLIASSVAYLHARNLPEHLREMAGILNESTLRDSIFPDYEVIDLTKRQAAVNFIVLEELAQRAERQENPFNGMRDYYAHLERSWVTTPFFGQN